MGVQLKKIFSLDLIQSQVPRTEAEAHTCPDKHYSIAHEVRVTLQERGTEEEDPAMLWNDAFAENVIEFSLLTSFYPDDILQTHVKRTKNNKQPLF